MGTDTFVCNASPLIGFERLGEFELLQHLTQQIYIPSAVRMEVFGSNKLPDWIIERPITQPLSSLTLSPRLGLGESEAIVVALEMQPCYLLLDDLAARRTAQALNINVIGTLGLLVLAKQRNKIPLLRPYLDQLLALDFRISNHLYEVILNQVGESTV